MTTLSKSEATNKRLAEAAPTTTSPTTAGNLQTNNPTATDDDAVIIIESLPADMDTFSWKKFMLHMGPGFLMCIAYIDPGNLEADLQTGAYTGYSLLWLLLLSTSCGYFLQSLSAKLGVTTGRHLAQHCRDRYPAAVRIMLWLVAETAIIGADIQEVIGTAIALSLLSGGFIPLWTGVIAAAVSAYIFLFLEKFGIRYLEFFFQVLVGIMAVSMGLLFFFADVPYGEVARGFLIPKLDAASLPTAAALIGSILMPHNLFLHSALVHNRALPPTHRTSPLRETLKYYNLEAAVALCVTLLINTSVISVFARGFYKGSGGGGGSTKEDIGLENAGQYLGTRFGPHMRLIWGIGLLAAGQSSTMTGTYAGQYVMSGYLNLRINPSTRALVTRAVAIAPTLLVSLYARDDSTRLDVFNQWLNILQAVQLPFAVLPLLALTGDRRVMGIGFVNSTTTAIAAWGVAAAVMAVNTGTAYQLIGTSIVGSRALHAVFGFGAACYAGLVLYLLIESWLSQTNPSLLYHTSDTRGVVNNDLNEDFEDSIVAPLLLQQPSAGPRPLSPARDYIGQRPGSGQSQLSSYAIDSGDMSVE
jgi:natural resistance-associated macrophage protein 2